MAGLDPNGIYKVHELNRIDLRPLDCEGISYSGAYLMGHGLEMPYRNDVEWNKKNDWSSRVLCIDDVARMAEKSRGELDTFSAGLPAGMDAREKGIAIANRMAELAGIKGPAVIVGFLPPYYPHRINRRATGKDRRLRAVMERLCGMADSALG